MTRHLRLVSAPLPECRLCERPTRRDTHDRHGGLCTECNDAAQALADRFPPRRLPPVTSP